MFKVVWRPAALTVLLLVLCSGMATPAEAAAGWSETRLSGLAGELFLFDVSCPSASFCVATGSQNLIASSSDPGGGAADWNAVYPGSGPFESDSRGSYPTNSQVQGVSCPTTHLCVAVTNQGTIYASTDPTGPASVWDAAELSPKGRSIHLYGVSCPGESLCVAVSGRRSTGGRIFASTDPTGGAAAWQETDLGESFDLRAISCSSPDLCVAVGAGGEIIASRSPTGGAGAWSTVGAPGGAGTLQSLSCLTGLCLTGNTGGNLLAAADPTVLAGWHESAGGASVQITGSSCATPKACLAVDSNGDVIVSTDPTGAHPGWALINLRPYSEAAEDPGSPAANALFGASCPTTSFCALVGSGGAILTSGEPFAAPTAAPGRSASATGDAGGRHRGSLRPHAKIARLHFKGRMGGGFSARPPRHVGLMMRFYAEGPVRRLECRLDHHRWRRCRSPHRYGGIGRGIHRVSVRAVGRTGLRGRPASRRFYLGTICRGGGRRRECEPGFGEIPKGWTFRG